MKSYSAVMAVSITLHTYCMSQPRLQGSEVKFSPRSGEQWEENETKTRPQGIPPFSSLERFDLQLSGSPREPITEKRAPNLDETSFYAPCSTMSTLPTAAVQSDQLPYIPQKPVQCKSIINVHYRLHWVAPWPTWSGLDRLSPNPRPLVRPSGKPLQRAIVSASPRGLLPWLLGRRGGTFFGPR